MVDEYQDTKFLQYRLVTALSGNIRMFLLSEMIISQFMAGDKQIFAIFLSLKRIILMQLSLHWIRIIVQRRLF